MVLRLAINSKYSQWQIAKLPAVVLPVARALPALSNVSMHVPKAIYELAAGVSPAAVGVTLPGCARTMVAWTL